MANDIKDINVARAEIDRINREMIDLFRRRMDLAADIAAYKQKHGLPVIDRAREEEILADMAEAAGEAYRDYAKTLFAVMMELSKEYQSSLMVAANIESHPDDVRDPER